MFNIVHYEYLQNMNIVFVIFCKENQKMSKKNPVINKPNTFKFVTFSSILYNFTLFIVMKRILPIFLLIPIFLLFGYGKFFSFKIIGNMSSDALDGQMIYLWEFQSNANMDSAIVENGKFVIEGSADTPKFAIIRSKDNRYLVSVFVEDSEDSQIFVDINLDNTDKSKALGTKLNDLFRIYSVGLMTFYDMVVELQQTVNASEFSTELEMEFAAKYKKITDELLQYSALFLKNNPGTLLSALILNDAIMQGLQIEDAQNAYDNLEPFVKDCGLGKIVLQTLSKAKIPDVAIGQMFRDLKMKTPDDKDISISDYAGKGNHVLIIFGGSWCTPCQQENLTIRKLYEKYNPHGLEIIGVALEENKENWIEMIKRDSITWIQMSDFRMWDSDAAIQYKIQAIPFNILLDENGIIIAINVRGHKLTELIELKVKS
jgi:peroxiredoxin